MKWDGFMDDTNFTRTDSFEKHNHYYNIFVRLFYEIIGLKIYAYHSDYNKIKEAELWIKNNIPEIRTKIIKTYMLPGGNYDFIKVLLLISKDEAALMQFKLEYL